MNNDLPFTYAVIGGDETLAFVPYKAVAEDWAFISKCKVVPLYDRPQPTLTDEERGAVERAADWLVTLAETRKDIQVAGYLVDDAATLRGLLERLGGEQ